MTTEQIIPDSEVVSAKVVLGRIAAWVFLALLLYAAILVIVSFPIGVYTVFFTHLSNSTTAASLGTPYLWLGPVALLLPFQTSVGVAFLAASAVYVAMFVFALTQGRGALETIAAALRNGVGEFFANAGLVTLIAIGFFIYTASIVINITSAFGPPIGNPFSGIDPLQAFIGFTLAPLREEFGFRVLIIGAVAFAVSFWRSNRVALRSLWRPSIAYEGLPRYSLAVLLIVAAWALSSGVFGACHVVCGGGGWDLGKLPEAIYGGVVLGYLYIRYGFHVAVLGHWGVDYLGSAFAFYAQGAYGIPFTSTSVPDAVFSVGLSLFGIACIIVVAYLGVRRLMVNRARAVALVGGS
ncbi:MAG: CPBP family glutamic-type intramembrane protease [Thaumarchaeota archaeon]|nr:CPBP family glutamic-type intramembrane protease [Nitrososphaerota archaeon]